MKRYLKSGKPTEDLIQATFFQWVYLCEQIHPELQLCFAIPNGGTRNIREAIKFKRTGVRKGVPDVFLPVPKGEYKGLWIEFKSDKGEQTVAQIIYFEQLKNQGYRCEICRDQNTAIAVVKTYLGLS